MSKFPSQLDDDVTLPPVNDNIDDVGAEAINACRDALFAIESEIGIGASGSAGSIAARLGVSLDPAGNIKPSAIASMGLVTLPIYNYHIADNAQITESKLKLDFRTQDLYNYIRDFGRDVNQAIGWIDTTGVKLDPHLYGALYRHELSNIDVSSNTSLYLRNKFNTLRDNTNAYTLIKDINDDLVQHQKADGSLVTNQNVTTFNGSVYPSNYAHLADGIFLNTSRFSTIPQTAQSIQDFAEYIDSASIFLYGTRIQNLYANGISRISRSSALSADGYGQPIIPPTTAITYLLNNGSSSTPVDNVDTGDDIIEFKPSDDVVDNNLFDSQFALIRPGDIVRVNYGGIEVPFVIREKKYIQGGGVKKFIVRINGKNLFYRTNASVRVDKPLFNPDKYGVLSVSGANNEFSGQPSLIVGSPRSAVALGLGFDPQLFDNKHYILYLALFPTGHPSDGYTILPGIDVTGNQGTTPGAYTLESIIEETNNAFRKRGFNYRFTAFQYKGEFGIMLADSIGNASFQILNGVISSAGTFDENATNVFFPNNVVGIFGTNGKVAPDPLGFGSGGSNVASPPYLGNYPTPESALLPAKLFAPLKRNNYYVNGIEREKLNIDVGQALDGYGDGYWIGEIVDRVVFPGSRVKVTYRVLQDLSISKLKVGKTLVVQSGGSGTLVDYGRFVIEAIAFNTCPGVANTDITVYDAIHATGLSPFDSLDVGNLVRIYFSADSVGFNIENSTDEISLNNPSFKRHFEVLADQNGDVFTHERARMNITGSDLTVNGITLYSSSQLVPFNIVRVSPKLRGYKFFNGTSTINKINLNVISYSATTGIIDGYLAMWDGTNFTRLGPRTKSRIGEVTRFFDETNSDYIDLVFEFNNSSSFTDKNIDIQLFPTLQLDEELFPIATCQVNDVTAYVNYIRDIRDFGNVSEKQLTTSALNYLSAPDRLLHGNGVVRGFEVTTDPGNPIKDQLRISGGVALVNGNLIQVNNTTVAVPTVREFDPADLSENDVTWALCVNDKSELQVIPLLDYPNGTSSRVFVVRNPITSGTYNIDAILFSDIINVRKDLCVLYIVSSVVTGSGLATDISITFKDVRKYASDQDTSIIPTVTPGNAQGNFKNFKTAIAWLKNNNTFQSDLAIKGVHTIATDPELGGFTLLNVFAQGAGAALTFQTPITTTNINFKDLSLNVNGDFSTNNSIIANSFISVVGGNAVLNNTSITEGTITISGNAAFNGSVCNNCVITIGGNLDLSQGNAVFNNCNIFVTGSVNALLCDFTRGSLTVNGVTFNNCNFNNFTIQNTGTATVSNSNFKNSSLPATTSTITNSVFEFSTNTFSGASAQTNVKFFNCTVAYQAGGTLTNVLINNGDLTVGATLTTNGISITDTTVNVSAVRGFTLGNNFTFERNTVTWTGAPVSGYTSTDIVNAGNGLIYASVGVTPLRKIAVNDNKFNTALQDRFPFFALQLTAYSSVVEDVNVINNTFTSTASSNDVRAVIAAVSTLTELAPQGTFPNFPVLVDVHFDENTCNYDQCIIVSSVRTQKVNPTIVGMIGAPPVVTNTTISGNVCGAIGYFVGGVGPYDGTNVGAPNNGVIRDKPNKLVIERNNCKLIATLDSRGKYIAFRATRFPSNNVYEEVGTTIGEVSIINNTCSWIQVGAGGYTSVAHSGANVVDNSLSPSNPAFLSNFTSDYPLQSITPSNVAIVLRREHNAIGKSLSIISGNNVIQRYTTSSDGYVEQTYYYDAGIVCFNNCRIVNNTIAGVLNSPDAPMIYTWDINSQTIIGNVLERRNLTIKSFFWFDGLSPAGTGQQRLLVMGNQCDTADPGAGSTNRLYYSYSSPTGLSPTTQPGWKVIHTQAGNTFS